MVILSAKIVVPVTGRIPEGSLPILPERSLAANYLPESLLLLEILTISFQVAEVQSPSL